MERRAFFRTGIKKAAQTILEQVDAHVEARANRWIRPPFALGEMNFLLACSRCDKCLAVCPPKILFRLPVRVGIQSAGTPAMDLTHKGCQMCSDWPCVAVCEPAALRLPAPQKEKPPRPKLAILHIQTARCLPYQGPECGACGPACPIPGALSWREGRLPVIHADHCTGCALCREACVTEPKAITIKKT